MKCYLIKWGNNSYLNFSISAWYLCSSGPKQLFKSSYNSVSLLLSVNNKKTRNQTITCSNSVKKTTQPECLINSSLPLRTSFAANKTNILLNLCLVYLGLFKHSKPKQEVSTETHDFLYQNNLSFYLKVGYQNNINSHYKYNHKVQ